MRQPWLPHKGNLLLRKGHAVGALVHSGIAFVGTHQDAVQGAVVLIRAMVAALVYGAFNGLIGVAIHFLFLLLHLGKL